MGQQQELLGSKIKRGAGTTGLVAPGVNLQVVDAQLFERLYALGTAQNRSPPCQQFGKRKGLDQIIVGTELETFYPVPDTITGRQQENRCANFLSLQCRYTRPAISFWQHDVNNEEVEQSA